MHPNFWFAIILSAIASLATAVGCLAGMLVRRPGPKFMAVSLGFSAGVMVFVSFGELLPAGIRDVGFLPAVLAFLGGMLVMFLVDATVPHRFVAEGGAQEQTDACPGFAVAQQHGPRRFGQRSNGLDKASLYKTGMLVALGITMHNLPEGMATFAGAMKSRGLGLAIAAAIALHNIPEGIAVSVPVYCATGSRRKAFIWSFLAGGAELAGAILAAAILLPFLTPAFLAFTLAAVAGLMVFIAFDELIPGSYAHGHEHLSVIGIILGMVLMAVSIWILGEPS